jgi:hypothetical protein
LVNVAIFIGTFPRAAELSVGTGSASTLIAIFESEYAFAGRIAILKFALKATAAVDQIALNLLKSIHIFPIE